MLEITRAQLAMLRQWFEPETPGPFVASHILHTGIGRAWVDRWPDVRAIVAETNYNFVMMGEPDALDPAALLANVAGFVAAPPHFLPMLESTFPPFVKWPRLVGFLPGAPIQPPLPNAEVRRLQPQDAHDVEMLSAESIWVAQTWGSGTALAQSGYGWGAWVDGLLAAVACTFFLGSAYEDIGVVTEPPYRRRGLSSACVHALCLDILARGHKASWTTSTDNPASWRVAQKLGFVHQRNDWLYVIGQEPPKSDS